ncbi:membrane hypothetical protein [Candidatus Zixiibacteriota bacterium]|nr:membrane hypothetical protein [candidate division Zixibacteria bacterium]
MATSDSTIDQTVTRGHCRETIPYVIVAPLIAFVFYFLTAFRTITWWDNGEYSLAALTLGIPHPPGSLMATILGWLVTWLPLGIPKIFLLNLFAGFLAACTVALVIQIGLRLYHKYFSDNSERIGRSGTIIIYALAALSGLGLGLGETMWLYAVKFTPYVITPLFTALILWAMFRWWEEARGPNQIKWLFLIMLLFGLDFSVHRTNILLLPGFLVWLIIGNYRVLAHMKSRGAIVLGFLLGLCFHLLIIPMAARKPFLNVNDPSNLSRFWDYITLKQYGGKMLFTLFPRKGDFWHFQVPDYINTFSANFLSFRGELGIFGILPFIFGLIGLIALIKKNARLGISLLILFLFTSAGAIIYFNVPADFFRSMDRHYLPSLVIFSVWTIFGVAAVFHWLLGLHPLRRTILLVPAIFLVSMIPISQTVRNYSRVDGSRDYFACDVSTNLLNTVANDGILFVGGDNETWPLWFLQKAEKVRPDITVINMNLMNTDWYMPQVFETYPGFPFPPLPDSIRWNVKPWHDTAITIPGDRNPAKYELPDNTPMPDSVVFDIKPNIAGKYLLGADWILLQIIQENNWKRPLYFSAALPGQSTVWIGEYLRPEGTAARLIPVKKPPINLSILRNNLLEKYRYRGFNDFSLPLEKATVWSGQNYLSLFSTLFNLESQSGDTVQLRNDISEMRERLIYERLDLPENAQYYYRYLMKMAE